MQITIVYLCMVHILHRQLKKRVTNLHEHAHNLLHLYVFQHILKHRNDALANHKCWTEDIENSICMCSSTSDIISQTPRHTHAQPISHIQKFIADVPTP